MCVLKYLEGDIHILHRVAGSFQLLVYSCCCDTGSHLRPDTHTSARNPPSTSHHPPDDNTHTNTQVKQALAWDDDISS